MRLPESLPRGPLTPASPLWPPILATRGPGAKSGVHQHHALHLLLAVTGSVRFKTEKNGRPREAAGILTASDAAHEIDARGVEVALVFLDPESEAGAALAATLDAEARAVTPTERDELLRDLEPMDLIRTGGDLWLARAVQVLGGAKLRPRKSVHPRVRQLLRSLRTDADDTDHSLEALARSVKLSPGRLMHAFTASIGLPLRPYLAWLKLQRAAGAIVAGASLTDAAHAAGFADAAHMTRTFRRMFGVAPSALRPRTVASSSKPGRSKSRMLGA
jgi:AraC-like DNA-binding protein